MAPVTPVASRSTSSLLSMLLQDTGKGRGSRKPRSRETDENLGAAVEVLARRALHHLQQRPRTPAEHKSASEIQRLFDLKVCRRLVEILVKACDAPAGDGVQALLPSTTFLLSIGTTAEGGAGAEWRAEVRQAGGLRRLVGLLASPSPSVAFSALRVVANFFRWEPGAAAAGMRVHGQEGVLAVAFREAQDERHQLVLLELLQSVLRHVDEPQAAAPGGGDGAGSDALGASAAVECAALMRAVLPSGVGRQALHWLRRGSQPVVEAVLDLLLQLAEPPAPPPLGELGAARAALVAAVGSLNAAPPLLELLGRPLGEECLALGAQALALFCCGLTPARGGRGRPGAPPRPEGGPPNHGRAVVDGGGIPAVLSLLAESESPAAQLHALRVLAWCAAKHPEARAEVRKHGGLRMLERLLTAGEPAAQPRLSFSALPPLPPLPEQSAQLARFVLARCVPSLDAAPPAAGCSSPTPTHGSSGGSATLYAPADDPWDPVGAGGGGGGFPHAGSAGGSSIVSLGSEGSEPEAMDVHIAAAMAGPVPPEARGAEWESFGFHQVASEGDMLRSMVEGVVTDDGSEDTDRPMEPAPTGKGGAGRDPPPAAAGAGAWAAVGAVGGGGMWGRGGDGEGPSW